MDCRLYEVRDYDEFFVSIKDMKNCGLCLYWSTVEAKCKNEEAMIEEMHDTTGFDSASN